MAGELLASNIRLAPRPEEADVVIVNTCAFIEEARREAFAIIQEVCRLKAVGHCKAVLVAGCLPQRYQAELAERLPDVDGFIGLDELDLVPTIVERLARGEHVLWAISRTPRKLFAPRFPTLLFTGGPWAYLRIAEGCRHRCSFCAIPAIRGRMRSRPLSDILREAEQLLAAGVRELNLIAQDITAYGRDRVDGNDLAAVLRAIGGLGGRFWIRLLYAYPSAINDKLLHTMANIPQVCHYLDVPIQHSHPDILRAMARADTIRPLATLAARARAVMPDIALRTTCLVGFPGETETRFRHLLEFIRHTEFTHLGVFCFSPEEGTPAAAMSRRPARRVAEQRRARLMLLQRHIVRRHAVLLLGSETELFLEKPPQAGRKSWIARSAYQAPEIDGRIFVTDVPPGARPGDFVRARYTAISGYDLRAVAVSKV